VLVEAPALRRRCARWATDAIRLALSSRAGQTRAVSTPSATCACGSGLPPHECHEALLTEQFEAPQDQDLFFTPPPHILRESLAGLAENISAAGVLKTELREDGRLSVALAGPLQHLRHYPVTRQPAREVQYREPPLRDVAIWPPIDLVSPERLQRCREALSAPREVGLEWLRRIQNALVGLTIKNSAEEMLKGLEEAVPLLLHSFPAATVDCLLLAPVCHTGPRAPSILASLHMQPVDEILSRLKSKKTAATGPHYIRFDPVPYFSILHNLAFPFVTGFSFGHASFSLQVDYGEPVLLPTRTRDDRDARDIYAGLFSAPYKSPELVPRMSNLATRHLLRAWLTRRLNYLFAHLTAPGTFASASGEYDPEHQWQDMLTVDDIVTLTGMLLTESQPTTTRLLFFDLMDRYAVLHDRQGNPSFVLNAEFVAALADAMDPGLGPLKDVIAADLRGAWADCRDSLWSGLLDESMRTGNELVIRAPDGTEEERLTKDQFATRILETLRNTTHGYDLKRDQFRRLLMRHNCLLPEAVRYLALGFWFGFMSKPSAFWGNRANFGGLRLSRPDERPEA
jgi:hypothetical protein